jgi:hypothetical protein
MSTAFTALIWWVVPLLGLLGGLGYVLWVTRFKGKFESETTRSVGQFQRFQESFRDQQNPTPSPEPNPQAQDEEKPSF